MIGGTAVASRAAASRVEDSPGSRCSRQASARGAVDAIALDTVETDDGIAILGWPDDVPARGTMLMLADPFSFPVSDFLAVCNAQVPGLTVVGGMASAGTRAGRRTASCCTTA